MKKFIIIANWKMHKTLEEATRTYLDIVNSVRELKLKNNIEIVIASSFPFIYALHTKTSGNSQVLLAAQNCSGEIFGAYTGEVSTPMIKSVGAKYVIIGHSEPRKYLNETDVDINKKIRCAIEYGLKPILCVGEPIEVRNENRHTDFVINQLDKALESFSSDQIKNIIVAYEPIWAIGSNMSASSLDRENMHKSIKQWLLEKYKNMPNTSTSIPILYGGSVSQDNIVSLWKESHVDGVLVGGASLNSNVFINMIKMIGSS